MRSPRAIWRSAAWAAVAAGLALPAGAGEVFDDETLGFARRVDLGWWSLLPVERAGRLEIVDTLARRQLRAFFGSPAIDGTSPTFSLLEIYFNAGAYLDRAVIRLRDRRLSARLQPRMGAASAEALRRTGRIAPLDFLNARAAEVLLTARRAAREQLPLVRLGSLGPALESASREGPRMRRAATRLWGRVEAFLVVEQLRIFPPAEAGGRYLAPEDLARAAGSGDAAAAVYAKEAQRQFLALAKAWRQRDAQSFQELSAGLLERLAGQGAATWPPRWRRALERVHNRLLGFTIAWAGYFAAILLLTASAAMPARRLLRVAGLAVFALSTLFLAGGVAARWIISGRDWHLPPLTNQYESVLAAALMAALAGMVLEGVFRRGRLALAASVFAMVALLCAFFRVGPLQPDIDAPMAVLNTSILAWHVATLMIGYGVIGMSLLVSAAYLLVRRRPGPRGTGPPLSAGADLSAPAPAEGNLPAELDRYNVILLQLACWLVAVGDLLGAYWADQAWGRWWGWDAKETWGLMTLLVYLGILHLRPLLPDRTRGAWTAALAVFGCSVMGFTWWGVNYLLRGLHSYA